MLHQTFLFLGQLWQLFEVSQILEVLQYLCITGCQVLTIPQYECTAVSPISVVMSSEVIQLQSQVFLLMAAMSSLLPSTCEYQILPYLSPADLVVDGSIASEMEIFSIRKWSSVAHSFHYQPPVVLILMQYC